MVSIPLLRYLFLTPTRLSVSPSSSVSSNFIPFIRFYSKKLSQPGLFPLKIADDELKWKVVLSYHLPKEIFLLQINGINFLDMPIQSEVNP